MLNNYQPQPIKLIKITPQATGIKLFRFEFLDRDFGKNFKFSPGQFIQLSIPGFGEGPFAPCGDSNEKYIELCVRNAGRLTEKIHSLKIGGKAAIRGPYGNGWILPCHCEESATKQSRNITAINYSSEDNGNNSRLLRCPAAASAPRNDSCRKNLLIIVGGLGLVPLRSLILGKEKFFGQDSKIQIFYGAKNPDEMLFRYEYNRWRENNIELRLTTDKECAGWAGCVGLVTTLFDKFPPAENSRAFVCGPPVMYKSAIAKLKEKNFADEDIFLSLERRMHCAVGVCQHCAVGPYYTCKDGPVFRYDKIKDIEGAI